MNLQSGRYDPELQMFAESCREVDLTILRFWRWLGEHDRLEHPVAGEPVGAFAAGDLVPESIPSQTSTRVAWRAQPEQSGLDKGA